MADGQRVEVSGSKPVDARHSEVRSLWRRYATLKQSEITMTPEAYIAELTSLLQASEARQLPPFAPQNTDFSEDKTELLTMLRSAIRSKQTDLQQAKQPENSQAVGFSGEAFELELTSKTEYNGEFQDLNTLRNITAQFRDKFSLLKDSYYPENVLTDGSADAFKRTEIDRAISGIDADVNRIQLLSAKLQDKNLLRKVLEGVTDQTLISERQMYFQSVLPQKLVVLRNELLEKRGRFQTKKDQLTGIVIQDIPEIRTLLESMMKTYTEAKASRYSSLVEFINLRKDILSKKNIDLSLIAANLRTKHGISEEKVSVVIEQIQKDVLDRVSEALVDLDNAILVFWRDRYIRNASTAPEFVTLDKKLSEKALNKRDSNADVLLSSQILEAWKKLSDKKSVFLSELPDSTRNDAAQEIDRRLTLAEIEAKNLLNEAKVKVKGEIEANPQIVDLLRTINVSIAANVADITIQEDAILSAKNSINRNAILASIPSILNAEAVRVLEIIIGDNASQEGLVGKKLRELKNAKDLLVAQGVEAKKRKLSDIVRRIIAIKPADAWTMSTTTLEKLAEELRQEIEAAATPPGYELDPTTYKEAKDNINSFIKERVEVTEKNILDQIDKLEAVFSGFDKQEALWNNLTDLLSKLKDRDPALYSKLSAEMNARKDLHITWMMVEAAFSAERLLEKIDPAQVDVTSGDISYFFKNIPEVADAKRLFDEIDLPDDKRLRSIPELSDVTAANYQQNKSKIIEYVASKTNPTAAKLAYRLHWCFFRPSEMDRQRGWTGKDEPGEVVHSRKYREKYHNKNRKTGPSITIDGLFNETGNFEEGEQPIIILPNDAQRGPRDPAWDLFPGFLHWCYEGQITINRNGVPVKKPKETIAKTHVRKILDFADKKYQNVNGQYMYENMPWEKLEDDVLKKWYSEMKGVGKYIYDKIMVPEYKSGEMKSVSYYESMTNKWQYAEAYIYGLREFHDQPDRQAEIAEQFREEWLLGVVWQMFNEQLEGASNWSWDEVRDVVKAAQNSKFVGEGFISRRVNPNVSRWTRSAISIGTKVAERLQKPLIEIESGGHH